MDAHEFKAAIEQLGYSQVAISRLLGVNDRTGRRWASGDQAVPEAVAICLRLMLRDGLTPDVMARILSGRLSREFGEPDPKYFVWVLPRFSGSEWTVAEYKRSVDRFFLPGTSSDFRLDELELGPRVHLDIDTVTDHHGLGGAP